MAVRRTEREQELTEEIGQLIGDARRRVWQVATRHLAELKLSTFAYQLLSRVIQTGGASQRELGELTLQHPAGVSRALDELEQGGLIQRQRDPGDRRKILVTHTPRGLSRHRKIRPTILLALDEALAPLAHADRLRLRDLLRLVGEPDSR